MVFSFQGKIVPLTLRHSMDLAVLEEIYIHEEYEWCPVDQPKVIVDLGAHFGDTALYYHCRFPEATIIAVEPSPESYKRLLENTKAIAQIIPVQAAIADFDGEMTLNIMPSSLGNSLSARKEATGSVQVPTMKLGTLLAKHNIDIVDLLKFDIEGAEFFVFKDFDTKNKINALIGEVHEDLGGGTVEIFISFFPSRSIETEQLLNKKRFIIKVS